MNNENTINMMQIINDLAYPRLSGTENDEVRCKNYLIDKFHSLGQEPVIEKVPWSEFSTNILLRIIVGVILAGLIISLSFEFQGMALINLVFILALVSMVFSAIHFQQSNIDRFATLGHVKETFNIYSKIPSESTGNEGKIKNIMFVAHHDTKSQKVVTMVRTTSYVVGLLLSMAIALLLIISSVMHLAGIAGSAVNSLRIIAFVLLLVDLVPMGILIHNKTIEGKSLGSLDNATGMSIVLKLLEYYNNNAPEVRSKANLWFVITGAEEWGMCGAVEFWRKHHVETKELEPDSTFVLNFDMVAGELSYIDRFGFGKEDYNKVLNKLLRDSAEELKIECSGFWLPMLGTTDGWVFRVHGCDTADIVTKSKANITHSAADTPEACDLETLNDAVKVSINLVKKLVEK
ncbi:MAG: M28 family peptidase [Promethearchaeota archaeon]